ncbi:MAG: F0F1 ATP synthase subunit B [Fulvimarina manganoxydans]|uniref:F0F1 ATP synthase subunit B n=1 Tax=Fulvimarina manganoxydans TaxID=937218 RepID=UPI0023551728|nr:F0F1 ATP synthase subunit B [Fulvimarina manganoxydans]MCK5934558.1 F0F1 ATP synthase subunit B [Fulvimarina manganoxydans]
MLFVTAANAQDHGADANHAPIGAGEDAVLQGEVAHGSEGHEAGFPPMNPEFFPSQILWLAITFGIFYWLLKNTIVPRIGGILENRRDRIALDLEAAERAKSDADEAQAAYEQELAEARERAHKIGQDARDSARTEAEAERKKLDADLDKRLEEAQARIAETKANAMREVDGIATEVTEAILKDAIGIEVSRDEAAAAVSASRG